MVSFTRMKEDLDELTTQVMFEFDIQGVPHFIGDPAASITLDGQFYDITFLNKKKSLKSRENERC